MICFDSEGDEIRYLLAAVGDIAGKSTAKVAMGSSTRTVANRAMDFGKAIEER